MNPNHRTSSMTILLVDDHDDTRESIQAWLESEGHTTFTARDVKSALKVGRHKPFDLMLCDIQLPDGDGRTILEKLGGPSKILAVAISGHGNAADLAQSKAAGFFAHLVKPFITDDLESMLASAQRELQSRKYNLAPASPIPD